MNKRQWILVEVDNLPEPVPGACGGNCSTCTNRIVEVDETSSSPDGETESCVPVRSLRHPDTYQDGCVSAM